jgi:hypothetical protein
VDDTLFVRDFALQEAKDALAAAPAALGFSLRLGRNISHSYVHNQEQSLPVFATLEENILSFIWKKAVLEFNYPLEVSSSIYRLADIQPLLETLSFENPNQLEGNMVKNVSKFSRNQPYLLCYETSVAFCNPVNKVQTLFDNRAGEKVSYSSEELAGMYEEGLRVRVEALSDFIPQACHQEVELHFSPHGL